MATTLDTRLAAVTASARGVDEAYAETLRAVISAGNSVQTRLRSENGKPRNSLELLNFQTTITDPLQRITSNPVRPLNVIGAVARFVWMVGGNERLADIAFYEPKVRFFTDDFLSIPGSNYGKRLFQPRPGLNQIAGVIGRLQEEEGSRRGAAVVWTPEDAVRESRDIPCAFGTFYHVRDEKLYATTIMRSNNAFLLFPFNIFEFGLVAEMIARSVGIELGAHSHFASSMHIYSPEVEKARAVVAAFDKMPAAENLRMPPMPTQPAPLDQAQELARMEAVLRNNPQRLLEADRADFLEEARRLHPYWAAMYLALVTHAFTKVTRWADAAWIADTLPLYFRASASNHVWSLHTTAEPEKFAVTDQLSLLPDTEGVLSQELSIVRNAFAPTAEEVETFGKQLEEVCLQVETQTGQVISLAEFRALRRCFVEQNEVSQRLAAQSDDTDPHLGAQARLRISAEEVQNELRRLRRDGA